jgi:hypothetical protein
MGDTGPRVQIPTINMANYLLALQAYFPNVRELTTKVARGAALMARGQGVCSVCGLVWPSRRGHAISLLSLPSPCTPLESLH